MTDVTISPTGKDQSRDKQIERYAVLGQPPGRDLQALVDLAAQVCDVPVAAINLLTTDGAHAIATSGVDPFVCALQDSMCTPVLDNPALVVVEDAREDPRYESNPMVTGAEEAVRFYASVPLHSDPSLVIGRLCVFDRVPRTLSDDQRTALQTLADRVIDVLDLRLRNRQLEQSLVELSQTQDELRRSNDQLALFAGQVSHDLRSPVTAITVNMEMLTEEPKLVQDADLLPLAAAALRASLRMAGLIDGFLANASFGGQLRRRDADLNIIVKGALDDLGPALRDAGAQVLVDELPVVCADPGQLYSVVLNLLSNAVKYARASVPPQVRVRATTLPDRWRVEIADNGVGIPADRRGEVFELFARFEETVDGHGIGLPTALRIVEAHGGRIGITEGRRVGTEVWFELPRTTL